MHYIRENILLVLVVILSLMLEGYGLWLGALGYAVDPVFGGHIQLACETLADGVYPWEVYAVPENMEQGDITPRQLQQQRELGNLFFESEEETNQHQTEVIQFSAEANRFVAGNGWMVGEPRRITPQTAKGVGTSRKEESSSAEASIEWPVRTYTAVDMSYFEDALFIGDSRMVGVGEYAGLEGATFYAKTGMTIYNLLDTTVNASNTIREKLETQSFGKIYIMVGINELGVGDVNYFLRHYQAVLEEIANLQPQAIIYVQAIMHVSSVKNESDPYFNNRNINERNAALATLADQRRIFYLDVNPVYDDENGNLASQMTGDHVHLLAAKYNLWQEFFLTHGIVVE